MLESWLPVVSALIGAGVGGSIGFFGAYLIQKRTWKRQTNLEIVKTVYEPLFQQIMSILIDVKNFRPLDARALKIFEEIKGNPLYWDILQEILVGSSQLDEHLKMYQQLRKAIQGPIYRITKGTMEEYGLLKEGADPLIHYKAFLDGTHFITLVSLEDAILEGKTPRELVEREIRDLKNVKIQTVVSGFTAKENHMVDEACEKALVKAEREPVIQQFRKQHESLIQRLNQLKDMIRSEIRRIKKI